MRSVIPVIDMHQLTKDPVALSPDFQPTATSPRRDMDAVALSRKIWQKITLTEAKPQARRKG